MTFITSSPEETRQLAQSLAAKLNKGDCIALYGEMGAGKTVFVQGLVQGLGLNDYVTSPTFTLMNVYGDMYHFDLYRLKEQEIVDAGLDEFFFDKKKISVVEWPVEELLPPDYIKVIIEIIDETKRRISVYNDRQLNSERSNMEA